MSWRFTTSIPSWIENKDPTGDIVVLYRVNILLQSPDIHEDLSIKPPFFVLRRYTHFKQLYEQLKARFPDVMKARGMTLPPRHTLIRNGQELWEKRRGELETWLWRLISVPSLASSATLRAFLEVDRAVKQAEADRSTTPSGSVAAWPSPVQSHTPYTSLAGHAMSLASSDVASLDDVASEVGSSVASGMPSMEPHHVFQTPYDLSMAGSSTAPPSTAGVHPPHGTRTPPAISEAGAASAISRLGMKLEHRGHVKRLVETLHQRVLASGKDLRQAVADITLLTEANKMLSGRVQELEAQLGGGRSRAEVEMEARLEQSTRELDTLRTLVASLQAQAEEGAMAQQQLEAARLEIARADAKAIQAERRTGEIEAALKLQLEEVQNTARELAARSAAARDSAISDLASVRQDLDASRSELAAAVSLTKELQEKNTLDREKARADQALLAREVVKLRSELASAIADRDRIALHSVALSEALAAANTQLQELGEASAKDDDGGADMVVLLRDQVAELQADNLELYGAKNELEEASRRHAESEQRLVLQNQELQERNAELTERLAAQANRHEEMMEELQGTIAKLQSEVQSSATNGTSPVKLEIACHSGASAVQDHLLSLSSALESVVTELEAAMTSSSDIVTALASLSSKISLPKDTYTHKVTNSAARSTCDGLGENGSSVQTCHGDGSSPGISVNGQKGSVDFSLHGGECTADDSKDADQSAVHENLLGRLISACKHLAMAAQDSSTASAGEHSQPSLQHGEDNSGSNAQSNNIDHTNGASQGGICLSSRGHVLAADLKDLEREMEAVLLQRSGIVADLIKQAANALRQVDAMTAAVNATSNEANTAEAVVDLLRARLAAINFVTSEYKQDAVAATTPLHDLESLQQNLTALQQSYDILLEQHQKTSAEHVRLVRHCGTLEAAVTSARHAEERCKVLLEQQIEMLSRRLEHDVDSSACQASCHMGNISLASSSTSADNALSTEDMASSTGDVLAAETRTVASEHIGNLPSSSGADGVGSCIECGAWIQRYDTLSTQHRRLQEEYQELMGLYRHMEEASTALQAAIIHSPSVTDKTRGISGPSGFILPPSSDPDPVTPSDLMTVPDLRDDLSAPGSVAAEELQTLLAETTRRAAAAEEAARDAKTSLAAQIAELEVQLAAALERAAIVEEKNRSSTESCVRQAGEMALIQADSASAIERAATAERETEVAAQRVAAQVAQLMAERAAAVEQAAVAEQEANVAAQRAAAQIAQLTADLAAAVERAAVAEEEAKVAAQRATAQVAQLMAERAAAVERAAAAEQGVGLATQTAAAQVTQLQAERASALERAAAAESVATLARSEAAAGSAMVAERTAALELAKQQLINYQEQLSASKEVAALAQSNLDEAVVTMGTIAKEATSMHHDLQRAWRGVLESAAGATGVTGLKPQETAAAVELFLTKYSDAVQTMQAVDTKARGPFLPSHDLILPDSPPAVAAAEQSLRQAISDLLIDLSRRISEAAEARCDSVLKSASNDSATKPSNPTPTPTFPMHAAPSQQQHTIRPAATSTPTQQHQQSMSRQASSTAPPHPQPTSRPPPAAAVSAAPSTAATTHPHQYSMGGPSPVTSVLSRWAQPPAASTTGATSHLGENDTYRPLLDPSGYEHAPNGFVGGGMVGAPQPLPNQNVLSSFIGNLTGTFGRTSQGPNRPQDGHQRPGA